MLIDILYRVKYNQQQTQWKKPRWQSTESRFPLTSLSTRRPKQFPAFKRSKTFSSSFLCPLDTFYKWVNYQNTYLLQTNLKIIFFSFLLLFFIINFSIHSYIAMQHKPNSDCISLSNCYNCIYLSATCKVFDLEIMLFLSFSTANPFNSYQLVRRMTYSLQLLWEKQ